MTTEYCLAQDIYHSKYIKWNRCMALEKHLGVDGTKKILEGINGAFVYIESDVWEPSCCYLTIGSGPPETEQDMTPPCNPIMVFVSLLVCPITVPMYCCMWNCSEKEKERKMYTSHRRFVRFNRYMANCPYNNQQLNFTVKTTKIPNHISNGMVYNKIEYSIWVEILN